jgi:hypothetical protein
MVTASFLPLATLLAARLFGASPVDAAWFALITAVALLVVHGYGAARAANLAGIRLVAVTATAGLLGVAMIVLKALLQHHHNWPVGLEGRLNGWCGARLGSPPEG